MGKQAHPVDVHVGGRVRLRRGRVGISQGALGEQLGITFQQVQKYERGTNRMSASRLFQTAQVLGVPVAYFFEGLSEETGVKDGDANEMMGFVLSAEGHALNKSFRCIPDSSTRRKIVELVQAIAKEGRSPSAMPGAPRGPGRQSKSERADL